VRRLLFTASSEASTVSGQKNTVMHNDFYGFTIRGETFCGEIVAAAK
jgi:hypothetical protein